MTRWKLWEQPPHVLAYVLIVDAVAIAAALATANLVPVTRTDLVHFAVLAGCAIAAIELTRTIERHRELTAGAGPYLDLKAVWSLCAVIVLPPILATAMVLLTYLTAWLRIWPHGRPVPLFRWTFSCSTVLLGTAAAAAVLAVGMGHYPGLPTTTLPRGLAELGVLAAALVLRWAINYGLVIAAILISSPDTRPRAVFSNFSEQLLEAGSSGLAIAAAGLVTTNPVLLAGVMIGLLAMHRGLLLTQAQRAARIDGKTGLFTATWWHQTAQRCLERAQVRGTRIGLLIIDADFFKTVNDTHGHLVGDNVLRMVGQTLASEVRDVDVTGRFGGDEFVVLLTDVTETELLTIANRIRRRITDLTVNVTTEGETTLTVSIGAALHPQPGITTLEDLLKVADRALRQAKDEGRNQVRISSMSSA